MTVRSRQRKIRIALASAAEEDLAIVFGADCGDIHDIITAVRSVPLEIQQRTEHGDEQHKVVQSVPLAHALVGPSPKRQVVPLVNPVLLPLLREPVRVEPVRFSEPLEARLVGGREHNGPLRDRVRLGQREVNRRDVRDQGRRGSVPHHLPRHRVRVRQSREHLPRDEGIRFRAPHRQDLLPNSPEHLGVRVEQRNGPKERRSRRVLSREEEVEQVRADLDVADVSRLGAGCHLLRRLLHPEIDEAGRLLPALHPDPAPLGASGQGPYEPAHSEPRVSERGTGEVDGEFHEADVEIVVVDVEEVTCLSAQIRPNEDGLRSLEIHVTCEQPERDWPSRVGGGKPLPLLEVVEDNNLLQRGVGGESPGGEVGSDPTAEILVILARHVDEIVVPEELLAEGVAHEGKSVRPDIGEDLVGELGVSDEDDEPADDV
ncbi:hypothetical protein PanWU01x14_063580, partial [Parasponia andersonii]